MKTFAQFIQTLVESKRKSKHDGDKKKYQSKRELAMQRQRENLEDRKQKLQKQREEEQHRQEEERENDEYIKHVENLRAEIKKEIKDKHGIED